MSITICDVGPRDGLQNDERPLRAWHFHCPTGTEHVIVDAGDGLATVLAAGARHEAEILRQPDRESASAVRGSNRVTSDDFAQLRPRRSRPEK